MNDDPDREVITEGLGRYDLAQARESAIVAMGTVLYALLSAPADEAMADNTYLRVLTNAMHLRSFLLDWEPPVPWNA